MKCGHCLEGFHPESTQQDLGVDKKGHWNIKACKCPECDQFNFFLLHYVGSLPNARLEASVCVYPKRTSRPPCPSVVPAEYAQYYNEACLTLEDSPRASAALSRTCLQHLLREQAGVDPDWLSQEIEQALDQEGLPSYLAEPLDAIRQIGKFATHPIKDKATGTVVPVEPGEAEWCLNIVEGLFDFFFVLPEAMKKRKEALNKKLGDAGQGPMKEP